MLLLLNGMGWDEMMMVMMTGLGYLCCVVEDRARKEKSAWNSYDWAQKSVTKKVPESDDLLIVE